nr:26S proteasome non-ATPase regulatory subunit 9-like [Ciona intestinalis]|eukprot:XP_009861810.1 26S proteasome non-ATPase regulatory subunit 9-like [Ciona intestinalis]
MAEYLKDLIRKKDKLESDIQSWFDVLKSQGNVGMMTSLVDAGGFPRSDVDVVQVRTARHNIVCLQNDHRDVMEQIKRGLEEYHSQIGRDHVVQVQQPTPEVMEGFATLDLVSRDSPAEEAGLKVGDVIIEFGSVTSRNFQSIREIGEVVKHSVGRSLNIIVKRGETKLNILLTPHSWGGRGLLGCNVVAL